MKDGGGTVNKVEYNQEGEKEEEDKEKEEWSRKMRKGGRKTNKKKFRKKSVSKDEYSVLLQHHSALLSGFFYWHFNSFHYLFFDFLPFLLELKLHHVNFSQHLNSLQSLIFNDSSNPCSTFTSVTAYWNWIHLNLFLFQLLLRAWNLVLYLRLFLNFFQCLCFNWHKSTYKKLQRLNVLQQSGSFRIRITAPQSFACQPVKLQSTSMSIQTHNM